MYGSRGEFPDPSNCVILPGFSSLASPDPFCPPCPQLCGYPTGFDMRGAVTIARN